jgi:hypothetical protein
MGQSKSRILMPIQKPNMTSLVDSTTFTAQGFWVDFHGSRYPAPRSLGPNHKRVPCRELFAAVSDSTARAAHDEISPRPWKTFAWMCQWIRHKKRNLQTLVVRTIYLPKRVSKAKQRPDLVHGLAAFLPLHRSRVVGIWGYGNRVWKIALEFYPHGCLPTSAHS